MATIRWIGGAAAVAQVSTASIDTYDAASTYTVTIGGVAVSVAGDTDVATTAGNLQAALAAAAHPYFAAATWSNPSGGNITGTGDVAGVPFVAALSVSGGTGTVTDFADDTACTGPHHADNAANYKGAALPTTSDDLVIESGHAVLYGLDALTAVALTSVRTRRAMANPIGLEPLAFATSLDGLTESGNGEPEYRAAYFELNAPLIVIGEHVGPGEPAGTPRVNIKQMSTAASRIRVESTASATTIGRPSVRLLASDADCDVEVLNAPGDVGICLAPGETATFGDLLVSDRTAASGLYVGDGCTFTSFEAHGGFSSVRSAATVTEVRSEGGEMVIGGEGWLCTALIVAGGTVEDRHTAASGDDWTAITLDGGTLEVPAVQDATRNAGTMTHRRGVLEGDLSRFSATSWVHAPAAGQSRATRIAIDDQ